MEINPLDKLVRLGGLARSSRSAAPNILDIADSDDENDFGS